jgi:hypothetical protein
MTEPDLHRRLFVELDQGTPANPRPRFLSIVYEDDMDDCLFLTESGLHGPTVDEATRLVACWNVCVGIPTDDLDKATVVVDKE